MYPRIWKGIFPENGWEMWVLYRDGMEVAQAMESPPLGLSLSLLDRHCTCTRTALGDQPGAEHRETQGHSVRGRTVTWNWSQSHPVAQMQGHWEASLWVSLHQE